MRVDASLASLLFAASAAANYNGASSSDASQGSKVADLEAQVKSLKQELEDASYYTCPNSGAGSAAPATTTGGNGGNGGSPVYSTQYSTLVNTEYYTVTKGGDAPAATNTAGSGSGSGSGSGYNGGEGEGEGEGDNGYTSTEQSTVYSTVVDYNTETSTQVNTQYVSPAATPAPSQGGNSGYNGGNDNGSGNQGAPAPSSAPKYTSNPDYYAPAAKPSTSTYTTTVTRIVTPGQETQTSGANTGSDGKATKTVVETYPGTNPVPEPTADGSGSGSGAGSSYVAPSTYIPAKSSSSSALTSTVPPFPTGNGTMIAGSTGMPTGSSRTSTLLSSSFGTASATSSSASASATSNATLSDCSTLCSQLTEFNGYEVTPLTCTQLTAGSSVDTPEGQSSVGCAASFTPALDICQVTLDVKTTGENSAYVEVWLPNGNETSWNGRTMSTDNGGLNGCIHYVDMQYVSSMGFAAIGDNAGHNGSSFDGTWMLNDNQAIVDWSYRARHASVDVGKQLVDQFYSKAADYSYYIGCSTGGAQGMQSAQMYPEDFDGIISGASASDFNHLQSWSAHFLPLTGTSDNDTFLTEDEWNIVTSYVLEQCDEPIDGVADGILEDPLQCDFDVSAIPVCGESDSDSCLSAVQIQTVEDVYKPLYFGNDLVYPGLLKGAEVDAFRLGLLSGSVNGIARDFFRGGVFNDSSYDITTITKEDMMRASELDALHGYPSAFDADLSGFQAAGRKMMMYHGMADPMTSGTNSQRYYLKVAQQMGLSHEEIDNFFRLYRISGMAHCGVGGISGAGAWMFGQSGASSAASNNIVSNLVNWVENDDAPDTLLGTKFWYDTPSMGIEFERAHCRFPYRTTYQGGDSTLPSSWGCELIEDWQECAGVECNEDGSFA
ncbi:hypothetical protein D0862_02593 [Hortaea werneckii]|uniref:Carboxylic ester hydrolase n=1 Tax=Hortaea werneckii TaxID=91943 RepID=A0A3M7HHF6_HORWE|nr:hypothetical protein D0862_02593 [Hortaea werneckii]